MIPEAIPQLLQRYFDALYHADAGLLASVMHPKAIYASADEQPLLYRNMEEYLPVVARRVSPSSRGEPRNDQVETICLAGENTAMARVRCSIGKSDFTDFLTLVRDEGEWRIMAKIFQIKPKEK